MSELLFNERYATFINSPDDVESDALGVISSLVTQIDLATKLGLTNVDIPRLTSLQRKVESLFAQYRILRETTTSLYSRYQEEKQLFLSEIASEADETEFSEEEYKRLLSIIQLRVRAYQCALAQLAPSAVIRAIKKSSEFTPAHAEGVEQKLSSYRMVEVSGKGVRLKTTATAERLDEQLVQTLKANTKLNTVVVNAPPGSGKTTLLNNLELEFRQQGWEVVQVNFDKVIAVFFKLLQQETKQWSGLIAQEFDRSFFNIEQLISEYYPDDFKDKRVIVLIDTLGYRIDNINYGLWLISKLLRPQIEAGRTQVVTVIPQPAIVEKTKHTREDTVIDTTNAAATLAKSKGAPAQTVIRHHEELGKKVQEAKSEERDFQRIATTIDMSLLEGVVPPEELAQMQERLAYAILTRNILNIQKNWWFAFNLLKKDGETLSLPKKLITKKPRRRGV